MFNRPVEDLLGKKTRWVLAGLERGESYLIYSASRKYPPQGLEGYVILARGPELSNQQKALVQELVFDPQSFYNGVPRYRRLPHKPGFALRLVRENTALDLLVDLHNPGWDFVCGNEKYSAWNWVRDEFVRLAKALFPKYASPNRKSVWRKGVIHELRNRDAG